MSLPAIISDMIEKLHNESLPEHIRYNYFLTLSSISSQINENCNKFERNRALKTRSGKK